jgi:penicillin-binding protein 2
VPSACTSIETDTSDEPESERSTMEIERQYRDELVLRLRVLSIAVSVFMAVVAGGFWYVQIVRGGHYSELSENNRLRRLTIRAPRGVIYDRDGEPLVENAPSYNLLIDRSRTGDVTDSLAFAAEILDRPIEELGANLERGRRQPDFQPVPVARDLTLAEVARLSASALEHPEFEIDVGHLRLYRHGVQTAHVLGYLGEVSEEELAAADAGTLNGTRYRAGDLIGKKGVERIYDPALRGDDGERSVVVDSRGRLIQEFTRVESAPGRPIYLTLDLDLQQEAERLMRDKVGAIVALDPRDGAILAMVSSPSYDPNMFARGIRPAEWQELLEDENDPLQNRVIQNAFAPGSTFKAIMATAGLAEGVITPSTRIHCSGSVTLYKNRFRCWRPGGHGSVDLNRAIAQSCNVYFYQLGKSLGIERIAKWARMFGLGRPTGIELGGERAGVVPDEAWSARVRNHPWYPGETISVAIGQGALNVTPLQMARATAVVANGGKLVTPHLVRDREPPPAEPLDVDPQILAHVRAGMGGVLEPGGTAHWSGRVEGLAYGGKTGTVQVVGGLIGVRPENQDWAVRNHAWFISFAPLDDPQIVVVVFNEHGGAGSSGAAPIAAELYRSWFGLEAVRAPAVSTAG